MGCMGEHCWNAFPRQLLADEIRSANVGCLVFGEHV